MPEHKKLWDDWCDRYYLELLDIGLNYIPMPPKSFSEMEEFEMNAWLSKTDLAKSIDSAEKKCKVKVPSKDDFCHCSQDISKTDVIQLPLSTENIATLTGTASILEEFGKEFSIPCPEINEIPFNKSDKKFDIGAARNQFDFIRSVHTHQAAMLEFAKQLTSLEKELDGPITDSGSTSDGDSDSESDKEDGNVERATETVSSNTEYW